MPKYLNPDIRAWTGKWIWCEGCPDSNAYAYFRCTFTAKKGRTVRLALSADTRYRLYVNGVYAGMGPIQSQPYYYYFDERDITALLRDGENALAFEVFYGGHIQDSHGGLLYEVQQEDGTLLAVSGEQTRTMPARAWDSKMWGQPFINRFAPYEESLDARRIPEGWKAAGYDDSGWSSASVLGGCNNMNTPPAAGPWFRLARRPIPFMRERVELPSIDREEECVYLMNRFRPNDLSISLSQPGRPLQVSRLTHEAQDGQDVLVAQCRMDDPYGSVYNPSILLDFGKEITAHFELELEGHAGQSIEIGYAERLVNGYFNNALECQFCDRYILREGRQTFRSFNWRGFRYVRLIFKDCSEPVRVLGMRGIVSEYPFTDKGSFVSGDKQLESAFAICKRTVELCCNESLVDTPWREQSQWLGDVAAITLGGIYSLFGDTAQPKKFLLQSGANQLPNGLISNTTNTTAMHYLSCMIDYSFWWVIAIWDYYLYTGDRELLNRLYPNVCRLMQTADDMRDEYGMLYRVPSTVFLDWAPNDRRDECGPLNALYYGALGTLEKMAELKQDDFMREHAVSAQELIRENFTDRFWDASVQIYHDCRTDDGLSSVISEAGNMLPIYFGLADKEQQTAAFRHILEDRDLDFVEACPFLGMFTLRAAAGCGRMDLALEMIRSKWYGRFAAKGYSSVCEEWTIDGSYRNGPFLPIMRTLSHAWSAGPAEFLIRDLNGIRILTPGGKKISVCLQAMDEDYTVCYPLPCGTVCIEQKNGNVSCTVPEGVEVVYR